MIRLLQKYPVGLHTFIQNIIPTSSKCLDINQVSIQLFMNVKWPACRMKKSPHHGKACSLLGYRQVVMNLTEWSKCRVMRLMLFSKNIEGLILVTCSGVKYLSNNTSKYYLSRFYGCLYFTIYSFDNFHFCFTTFLKKIMYFLLRTFFPDTQMYSLNA